MWSLVEQRISALPKKGVQNKPIPCSFQLHFHKSFLTRFIAVIASSGRNPNPVLEKGKDKKLTEVISEISSVDKSMVLITSKVAVSIPIHILHLRVGFDDLCGSLQTQIILCVCACN